MSTPVPAPAGQVARRTLQFFWLADYSGSMEGKKIASLNQAIREAIPQVRNAVSAYPQVQVMMRAIKFADDAHWHVVPAPVPVDQFAWPELTPDGQTATAKAIRLLANELTLEKMPRRGFPPVCLLVSDGHHTDPQEEYDSAISDLLKLPWGVHAVRLAITIGSEESEYDPDELMKFVSHKEVGLLKAHNSQELIKYIEWASVAATVGSSHGESVIGDAAGGNSHVYLPPPPTVTATTAAIEGF